MLAQCLALPLFATDVTVETAHTNNFSRFRSSVTRVALIILMLEKKKKMSRRKKKRGSSRGMTPMQGSGKEGSENLLTGRIESRQEVFKVSRIGSGQPWPDPT